MARLPDIAPEPNAKAVSEALAARRGHFGIMWRTLLAHPDLAERLEPLGTFLRFEGTLPADVRELAILTTARERNARYVWAHHVDLAREAGVPEDVIDAVRNRSPASDIPDEHAAVVTAARCVHAGGSLPEELQDALVDRLGVPSVVELVVLCGYYALIAGVVSSFDVPLEEGYAEPW